LSAGLGVDPDQALLALTPIDTLWGQLDVVSAGEIAM